jgi:hypothetical protein
MPWPCFMVEMVKLDEPRQVYPNDPSVTTDYVFRLADGSECMFRELKVGAMFHHHTRGLCVKVPGGSTGRMWAMKEAPTNNPNGGWTLAGEPPNVTETPSINFTGTYHGWVTGGFVTDDCEGRKFDDYGNLIE